MENNDNNTISIKITTSSAEYDNCKIRLKGIDVVITDEYNQSFVRHIEYDENGNQTNMSETEVPRQSAQRRVETNSAGNKDDITGYPLAKTANNTIRILTGIVSLLFLAFTIKDYFFDSGELSFIFLLCFFFFGLISLYYLVKTLEDTGRLL